MQPLSRCAAGAIALSLGSLPFLLPHVLEDFERGIAQRAGLAPEAGAALLGAGLGVQFLALVLAGQGRRVARGLRFRGSALSALWVGGLIITQALAALLALFALIRGGAAARR